MLWDTEEEATACTMRRQGKSHREIADALGRSERGVKKKLRMLGMTNPHKRTSKAKEGTYGCEQPRKQYLAMLTAAEAQWRRLMEGRSFANIR